MAGAGFDAVRGWALGRYAAEFRQRSRHFPTDRLESHDLGYRSGRPRAIEFAIVPPARCGPSVFAAPRPVPPGCPPIRVMRQGRAEFAVLSELFCNATPQGRVDKFPPTRRGVTAVLDQVCDEGFDRKFHITHCGGVAKFARPHCTWGMIALFLSAGTAALFRQRICGLSKNSDGPACEPLTQEFILAYLSWRSYCNHFLEIFRQETTEEEAFYPVSIASKTFLPSDDRDVSSPGLRQEEGPGHIAKA